jgi:hypothetical protein
MSWLAVWIPMFGSAALVCAVYVQAKWGWKREPCIPIHDVRPYDERKLAWRDRQQR